MGRALRTAAFKKKVVLEAFKEDKTIAQIASQFGVHPMQVSQWKRELTDGAETIFTDKRGRKKEDWDREALERKVGQQAIELDYLIKNLVARPEGETSMDRRQTHNPFYSSTVPISGDRKSKLLLRTSRRKRIRFALDEAYRRNLYQMALLWIKKNGGGTNSRRLQTSVLGFKPQLRFTVFSIASNASCADRFGLNP